MTSHSRVIRDGAQPEQRPQSGSKTGFEAAGYSNRRVAHISLHLLNLVKSEWRESINALQNQLGHVDSRLASGVSCPADPRRAKADCGQSARGFAPELMAPGNGSERVIQ